MMTILSDLDSVRMISGMDAVFVKGACASLILNDLYHTAFGWVTVLTNLIHRISDLRPTVGRKSEISKQHIPY